MLIEEQDTKKLYNLLDSLNFWSKKTQNIIKHIDSDKTTGSLYRFGWFYINDYKYSISGWKLKDGIVTFEEEHTGEKIKYNMHTSDVLNKKFKKDGLLKLITKKIRVKISTALRKLSDKLQP